MLDDQVLPIWPWAQSVGQPEAGEEAAVPEPGSLVRPVVNASQQPSVYLPAVLSL